MNELVIQFAAPVTFAVPVQTGAGFRHHGSEPPAAWRRKTRNGFVGDERAAGVDRLGFTSAAIARPHLPEVFGGFATWRRLPVISRPVRTIARELPAMAAGNSRAAGADRNRGKEHEPVRQS